MDNKTGFKKGVFTLLAVALTIAVSIGIAEVASMAYFTARYGAYMSVKEMLANEQNTYIRNLTSKGENCGYMDTLYPHPYLAFVHHGNDPCGIKDINNIGLFGADFPNEKLKDKFVILLTGGSVAAQFAQLSKGKPKYLEEILNENYIPPSGKKFLVLNGGDGAWKQPQQAILFMLYADAVDAVITLDGFNEHYNIGGPFRFEYPANSFVSVNPMLKSSYKTLTGIWLYSSIYNYSKHNWLFSHSHTLYLITKAVRYYIRQATEGSPDSKIMTSIESIFALPPEWDMNKKIDWSMGQYEKYIKVMNNLARMYDVKSAYFIQPVPAIGKALSEEEIRIVGDLSYKDKYQMMNDRLLKLNDEGIPVFSLLYLFQDHPETLYADAIHCKRSNGESKGYHIMAKRIAEVIGDAWELREK